MVSKDKVEALIREHMNRRPLMQAVDVYKLLHQGVFGIGHLLNENARTFLEAEASTLILDEQPEEPLLEEVSADGSMVRVNLRPYLRRSLPLDRLFSAMEASAQEKGREEDFLKAWSLFKDLARSGSIVFEKEIEELDKEIKSKGYLLHHHSEAYRKAYSPAYRVVKSSVMKKMFKAEELGNTSPN